LNSRTSDSLYLKNNRRGKGMFDQRRREAISEWREFMSHPPIRMTAEEHYDELLRMADAMEHNGVITGVEWRQLIRDAGVMLTRAREGLEGGT
jgi:hypothetical protein